VYDELVRLGYTNIIVVGTSFGGYMAALLAAQRLIYTLVLRAAANYADDELELPYTKTREVREHSTPIYRQDLPKTFTNRALDAVRQFDGQTYVIEHEADEVIHASIPRSYFAAARHGNYMVIPKLTHSPRSMPNPEAYFALVEFWIAAIVRGTRAASEATG